MFSIAPRRLCLSALGILALASPGWADGRVIAIGDEWLLSDLAYDSRESDVTALALNSAEFLMGGTGSVLVYSTNVGLNGASLASTMTNAGYGWTINTAQPFTLALLQQYDAVYLCGTVAGNVPSTSVLVQYVNGGGSVLVCSGTGTMGGPSGEAASWSPFLSSFGLAFSGGWFPVGALYVADVEPTANPVAAGVEQVVWGFGQVASAITPSDPSTDTILADFSQFGMPSVGVIATYGTGCASGCAADLDGSGTVDGGDLGLLLGAWSSAGSPADLNCDGVVDGADFGLLLGSWGPCA